jgi:hypothetical protein
VKIVPGTYLTKECCTVIITSVINTRAYGHLVDCRDTTWWYATSGEHGVYTPDDIIEQIKHN